ncbi:hypothetical protein DSL72_004065 [Monilinia vaccinii-corymbosi]|uniref:Uncharacterized protein n=1 Tax=Monilinia vaccinii-corymbosi TaxID=61207 RepID=A0A8A3NZJ3_9HELO|nr:hypothetical protein DSL72_004065 [Monilinia vaccinii-corymbosi]
MDGTTIPFESIKKDIARSARISVPPPHPAIRPVSIQDMKLFQRKNFLTQKCASLNDAGGTRTEDDGKAMLIWL